MIVELLNEAEKISVSEISLKLGVSEVTIRKDLAKLESEGLLKRQHGYAVRVSSDDINSRLAFNYDTKRKIALRAAEIVEVGETVMIESGSTCAILAYELAASAKDITIITNSLFIANYIRQLPGAKVMILGGDFQNDAAVTYGPITKLCARQFHVDKLFVGTDGFDESIGFTQINHMRADTVRAMRESVEQLIILTDSSKFHKRGVAPQFAPQEVNIVMTDEKIDADSKKYLQNSGVKVITV